MRPTWTPKGALEASKRPLGAESGVRELFGVILDLPKSSKLELKFNQKSSAHLEVLFLAVWRPLGVVWGSILGSFWAPFWAPGRIFTKTSTALQREHDFQGFGGSKNETEMDPKVASSGNLATRASWEPPGLDFQAFWASF